MGAVQHLQQGALAASAMADETDTGAYLQGEGEGVKQRPKSRLHVERMGS